MSNDARAGRIAAAVTAMVMSAPLTAQVRPLEYQTAWGLKAGHGEPGLPCRRGPAGRGARTAHNERGEEDRPAGDELFLEIGSIRLELHRVVARGLGRPEPEEVPPLVLGGNFHLAGQGSADPAVARIADFHPQSGPHRTLARIAERNLQQLPRARVDGGLVQHHAHDVQFLRSLHRGGGQPPGGRKQKRGYESSLSHLISCSP